MFDEYSNLHLSEASTVDLHHFSNYLHPGSTDLYPGSNNLHSGCTNLHPGLAEACSLCQLLPDESVGVVGLLEHGLEGL